MVKQISVGGRLLKWEGKKTRSQSISRIAAKDVEPDNFSKNLEYV